ncbi:E3 ubiquitin-protein ligase TRIM11-like [Ambystoma mexicanum]|uniref:E3 ubiquitin-protein ligase TRIM11-like n=1 Tax=Ambystoma mexicanum TaxID=8296 RepID=UPI0037E7463F
MAARHPITDLRQDALCSICQEFYKDPVIIDCGHNFCRACLTKYMEQPDLTISCPECKQKFNKKNLKPNKSLASMAESVQRLEEEFGRLLEGSLCGEHGEALRLFCDTDETLICLVCRESREHKEHRVRPIKEAHEDYKDKLYSHMERLKKELKDLLEWVAEESRKASELKGNIMKQRETILSTFDRLKQFLEQEKWQQLSRLEMGQEEKMKKIQEKLTRMEEQQSTHRDLITELESKCQQQDVDLLKVRGFQRTVELEQQSTHRGLIPEIEQWCQQQDRELQMEQRSTARDLTTELERKCQQQDVDLLNVRGVQKPIELDQQSTHRGLITEIEQRYQQQETELQRVRRDQGSVDL